MLHGERVGDGTIHSRPQRLVARDRQALRNRDRRHPMAVERRKKLGVAGKRAIGPLSSHEKPDATVHRGCVRTVAMRVARAKHRQQGQASDAVVGAAAHAPPFAALGRALDARAMASRLPTTVGRLGRHQPPQPCLHGPLRSLRPATGQRRRRPALAHAIGVGGGNRPRGW